MNRFQTALKLGLSFALIALFVACSSGKKTEPQAQSEGSRSALEESPAVERSTPGPGGNAAPGGNWDQAFKLVRDAIRTEPSRFPLKTPEGVRRGRSGNSLEKSLLLAQLLRDQGCVVEIAEGELDEARARELLERIFPPAAEFSRKSYDRGVRTSAPAEDPRLVAAVRRHFWVRMKSEDGWMDLAPAFPGAEAGNAFALPEKTYDPSDAALKTEAALSLEVRTERSPSGRNVLSWEGMLEQVADQPLSLSIVARFERAGGKGEEEGEEEEAGIGGLFGGLSGKSAGKKKGKTEKIPAYHAVLNLGEEVLVGEKFLLEEGAVTRIALRLKFESSGATVSECERVLFERSERRREPPLFQRHAILISANRIPAEVWQGRLEEISDKSLLSDVKSRVEDIKKTLKSKKLTPEVLKNSLQLEERLGPGLGHLINMIFASTSDDLTEREGAALSVFSYFPVPRVLITSFTGERESSEVTIDLRQDRVEAVPLPGQALAMKQNFLYGRGVMESILEGKLLELLTGKPCLTTAALMREAGQKKIPLRSYSRLEKERLERIGLPRSVAEKVFSTLDSGRVVILPEKAVEWQGQDRWAWWDVDPATMETIGVLDTGLHQAVAEYTILETEGPLETEAGYVIGAMVGAVDTYWVLSAMVLKHGELNKAALEEAKAYLEEINAVMCPGLEVKISLPLEPSECFDILEDLLGLDNYREAGVELSQGWCGNFAAGFACVSKSILMYYLSQYE